MLGCIRTTPSELKQGSVIKRMSCDSTVIFCEPSPPSKQASTPMCDDVSEEHPLFQAVHRNDLLSAKRAFKMYGTGSATQMLASHACRHDRPLHRAVRCGWREIAQYLLFEIKVPVDATKPDGATALFLAAQEGHAALVRLLIDAGANIDLPDEDGISPLYIACYQGHQSVVDVLLEAGADPNKLGLDGTSPTFIAAQEGYAGIVRSLALAGAVIDLLDNEGTAPLLMAAQEGRVAAVSMLLALGASPNTMTPRGVRPLHSASQNGHLRIVQLLMAYGADPSLTAQSGASPAKLASDFGHSEVASFIKNSEENSSSLLRICLDARLHWVAAAMLSSGSADQSLAGAEIVSLQRHVKAIVKKGKSKGFTTSCRLTIRLFRSALQPWSPRSHRYFGPDFRDRVTLLLQIYARLASKSSENLDAIPYLPIEMWFEIISHSCRRDTQDSKKTKSIM